MSSYFVDFQKIGRLSRDVTVTEKIDGTNSHLWWARRDDFIAAAGTFECPSELRSKVIWSSDGDGPDKTFLFAGSRSRFITPEDDNFGFARWAQAHAEELLPLGPGRHFGEWWGSGIQRGYGLTKGEKRFSLFAVHRWADDRDRVKFPADRPACCGVVPVLYRGLFDTLMKTELDRVMDSLRTGDPLRLRGS